MLVNELKLLLRFNDTVTVFEEVSQTSMSVLGDNTVPVISSSGYLMQNDQYLFGDGISSNGYNLDFTSNITIGFWLYPIALGISVDEKTGNLSSIEMPLLNFVDNSSAFSPIIEITEHTQDSGNNILKITEKGTYSVSSEEYSPGIWHHFWIVHDLSGVRLFVDGLEHTLQDEVGTFSSNLASGSDPFLNLYINHSIEGYSSSVAKNEGVIDDIFFLNISNDSETDIQRLINDGLEYIIDDNFTTVNINKNSIYFNDPETITINSMIDDSSYIFVGRNDGKIMRGSPLFWEVRKSYSDSKEHDLLGFSTDVNDNDLVTNGRKSGFLQLVNTTIRL